MTPRLNRLDDTVQMRGHNIRFYAELIKKISIIIVKYSTLSSALWLVYAKYSLAAPTDCIVEGEVLKLGGPFLQTWQKKHLKLYPNRLEFYHKNRDGQVVRGKGVEVCV